MNHRAPLFASLLAAPFVLLGFAAMNAAWTHDAAPAASQSNSEANPIDTSVATQPPAGFKRGARARAAKKFMIVHVSGKSGDFHQTSTSGSNARVVRNAIGQPVKQTSVNVKGTDVKASERADVDGRNAIGEPVKGASTDLKGIEVKASERAGVDAKPKNQSPAANSRTEAVGTASYGQRFVPIQAGGAALHDPRINTAMSRSIINGRDMVRPIVGAGAVGGPARTVAGISGTTIRPLH